LIVADAGYEYLRQCCVTSESGCAAFFTAPAGQAVIYNHSRVKWQGVMASVMVCGPSTL